MADGIFTGIADVHIREDEIILVRDLAYIRNASRLFQEEVSKNIKYTLDDFYFQYYICFQFVFRSGIMKETWTICLFGPLSNRF